MDWRRSEEADSALFFVLLEAIYRTKARSAIFSDLGRG